MTNQYKDVDERFDKEFTCIVTYEKWPDEEEQRLREPQYKFKDFPNTNPKMVKSFIHQELSRVREETIRACYEVTKDWENTKEYTPDWGRGFDEAKIGISKAITKLITKP